MKVEISETTTSLKSKDSESTDPELGVPKSTRPPLGPRVSAWLQNKNNSKALFFIAAIIMSALDFGLLFTYMGLCLNLAYGGPSTEGPQITFPVGFIILDLAIRLVSIIALFVDYFVFWRRVYRKLPSVKVPSFLKFWGKKNSEPEESSPDEAVQKKKVTVQPPKPAETSNEDPPVALWRKGGFAILFVLNIYSLIACIIVYLNCSTSIFDLDVYPGSEATAALVIGGFAMGFEAVICIILTFYLWWPAFLFSQCLVIMCSTLQIIISTVTLLVTNQKRLHDQTVSQTVANMKHNYSVYPHFSAFLMATAFLGLCIATTGTKKNRHHEILQAMCWFYIGLTVISLVLCAVWLGLSAHDLAKAVKVQITLRDRIIANPILSGCGVIIDALCLFSMWSFMKKPTGSLQVEIYDLAALTDLQRTAWAALIDKYSKTLVPGSPSGKEALDLMLAYVNSPMENFQCKILRVYNKTMKGDKPTRRYEQIKSWSQLDSNDAFQHDYDGPTPIAVKEEEKGEKKLSKTKLKRMQKKEQQEQKNSSKDKHKSVDQIFDKNTAGKAAKEELSKDFHHLLVETEALVLLTTIDHYDLTSPLPEKVGRVLRFCFGRHSPLNFLSIRFGLLATHWPFRQATFYTSPTRKTNARSVAILRAVSDWNDQLPRRERSTLLLDPVYRHNGSQNTFRPSGWLAQPLPPSHVVDLRKFKGCTMLDYLKAIKYRNQATVFNKAKGEVIMTTDFSRENCATVMELWQKIAEKRTSEGHTAVLANPTTEFVMSLGSPENNPFGFRRLLFLRVGTKIIASCVLYVLGDTITSDMQGLDHETARQYRAYFVMMQETIKIALEEGISFVDFGPTTSKPKMDIGAAEVPLVGGMHAPQPLKTFVTMFAGQIDLG